MAPRPYPGTARMTELRDFRHNCFRCGRSYWSNTPVSPAYTDHDCTERSPVTQLNMDLIAEILRTVHGIDNAHVQQTGGGCATIYAGPTREDPDYGERYAAIAGPGTYGWGDNPSYGSTLEFYVGADDDGVTTDQAPRDHPQQFTMCDLGANTEEQIAALIAAQAKKPGQPTLLTPEEVAALGLDITASSASPEVQEERARIDVQIRSHTAMNRHLADQGLPLMERIEIAEDTGHIAASAMRRGFFATFYDITCKVCGGGWRAEVSGVVHATDCSGKGGPLDADTLPTS